MRTPVMILFSTWLVLGCCHHCFAQQKFRSFDPDAVSSHCDRAVGKPASGWVGDQRFHDYKCAKYDLHAQDSDFAMLQRVADRDGAMQGVAFRKLVVAFKAFRAVYLDDDVSGCGGGNDCGASTAIDEAAFTHRFLLMLIHLQTGALPDPALNLATDDAALNASYRKDIQATRGNCPSAVQSCSTIETENRNEERAWLSYRNAFVAYAVRHWPAVPAHTWLAYLTHLRIAEIKMGS